MKTSCNFCKTEYNLPKVPTNPVQCTVCGHIWMIAPPRRKNTFLMVIAALCALLAAIVFAIVIITHHHSDGVKNNQIIATIASIETVTNPLGISHFVVHGNIINQSDEIYGVPDLIIISRAADGNIIAKQKFMPSATLLDPGATTKFSHTLSAPTTGVKKITVELKDQRNKTGE